MKHASRQWKAIDGFIRDILPIVRETDAEALTIQNIHDKVRINLKTSGADYWEWLKMQFSRNKYRKMILQVTDRYFPSISAFIANGFYEPLGTEFTFFMPIMEPVGSDGLLFAAAFDFSSAAEFTLGFTIYEINDQLLAFFRHLSLMVSFGAGFGVIQTGIDTASLLEFDPQTGFLGGRIGQESQALDIHLVFQKIRLITGFKENAFNAGDLTFANNAGLFYFTYKYDLIKDRIILSQHQIF